MKSEKLNNLRTAFKKHWCIAVIVLLTPLLLYAVWPILPTHDDWAGTTKPDFSPFFTKEHFFFYGYHWRPFDTWIGYVAGRNPQLLYPAFNHILVVAGHLLCSLCLYYMLGRLRFNDTARNMATLLFFLTPAAMATVTAIDSQNQVFALTVGIVSFLFYIRQNKYKYVLWPLLVFLAALCKENGLMWALICPMLAYGFDYTSQKTLRKDIIIGFAIVAAYFLTIAILPKDIIIHPEYEPGIVKIAQNVVKFFFTTFITADYIFLLHQPSRNLPLAALSMLFTLPLLFLILIRPWRQLLNKKMVCTTLCLLTAAGPHLLTIFSMMHIYAGLPFVAIMAAYSIDNCQKRLKPVIITAVMFVAAAIAIDLHLIDASVKSGLTGKRMAQEAIRQTGQPVKSVYVVIIEDDYPKLSSFCVIPNEAFGWGLAARYETNYQWPESVNDTTIARTQSAMDEARKLARQAINGQKRDEDGNRYDCVWIVDHDQVEVIR